MGRHNKRSTYSNFLIAEHWEKLAYYVSRCSLDTVAFHYDVLVYITLSTVSLLTLLPPGKCMVPKAYSAKPESFDLPLCKHKLVFAFCLCYFTKSSLLFNVMGGWARP
ncbi:hypothetical protein XELAEV_18028881mg [Xenopus laevis]|uniref:Uncharacterized protein n=1 Tax=Xenopus laevis TaxID=8355 RepID=A0A974CSZ5_XENLA|nr:hypothetical protein XELAEV_18028881mg [Xenopus laevis]